jgi:hypothetical protein
MITLTEKQSIEDAITSTVQDDAWVKLTDDGFDYEYGSESGYHQVVTSEVLDAPEFVEVEAARKNLNDAWVEETLSVHVDDYHDVTYGLVSFQWDGAVATYRFEVM